MNTSKIYSNKNDIVDVQITNFYDLCISYNSIDKKRHILSWLSYLAEVLFLDCACRLYLNSIRWKTQLLCYVLILSIVWEMQLKLTFSLIGFTSVSQYMYDWTSSSVLLERM